MSTKRAWVTAGFAITCMAMPVLGNVWTDGSADHLWDTAGNWSGGKPGANANAEFGDTMTGVSVVSTDTLGLWGLFYTNTSAADVLQINPGVTLGIGNTLVCAGVKVGSAMTGTVTVNGGGTLQIGDIAAAPLYVGYDTLWVAGGAYTGSLIMTDCTLNLLNVSEITVGYNNNAGWGKTIGLLDVSRATLVSGSDANILRVPAVNIGTVTHATGTLKLSPTVTNITVGTLEMGNSSGSDLGYLDLGTNSQLKTLRIDNHLQYRFGYVLGYDGSGNGVTGFPGNVDFKMGSFSQRAGMMGIANGGYNDSTLYTFGTGIKSIDAYITDLWVAGSSYTSGHFRNGTLDLRQTTLTRLDVSGVIKVGGKSGNGMAYLPAGRVTCATLEIGVSATDWETGTGLLSLSNTEFVVSGNATLGNPYNPDYGQLWGNGQIQSLTDGMSSGLDLAGTLTLTNTASIQLTFAGPPADPTRIYWGLRMAGDTSSQLAALNAAGKVTWTMPGLTTKQKASCGIHYDSAQNITYIGLPPEGKPPGTLIILMGSSTVPIIQSLPFVAASPEPGFPLPSIVLQYDPATKTGSDGAPALQFWDVTPPFIMSRAAYYLREGLQRMTGKSFAIVSTNDLSKGIVLTLLNGADESIRNDPDVQLALRADPTDIYANQEAYFIRSESNRLLVVANTAAGLASGVVDLLESTEYEVLGMGPDWIHVPDYRNRPLAFSISRSGRPKFYIRGLTATSGQAYGVGTITSGLTDSADEPVTDSYWRWQIGARLFGTSMPGFPGHALQAYHLSVIDYMRTNGETNGFLSPRTIITTETQRPPAAAENNGWLWIDAEKTAACSSDGLSWITNDLNNINFNLDLSMPFVREIIFRSMTNLAEAAFTTDPDALMVFPMDAEDGAGYGVLDTLMKNKAWYPDYLAASGVAFGMPYVLHGYNGLDQPVELWDPSAASDTMFGLANYLLREYDKWIDSLPADRRITASGQSKKDRVRASFYSYNYHDVPPNFNVDPRARVMIASYPKHRGIGKWEKFASQEDMARAFQVMLPREPSGDYRILTLAYYHDPGPANIPAAWSAAPASIAADYRRAYDAGYRAINCETDFNFGRYGLAYYLISKVLWNADLSALDLDAIRDRWFQRAFGGAWQEMKAYYDFMLTDHYPVNGPNTWAQAIRLLDAAARKLDGNLEPEAQRRIDDCKQFWYYHYLMDTGLYTVASPEVREYLWKGQMSYMVALHVLCRRDFGKDSVLDALGPEGATGPAHYTHAETQVWWTKILERWPYTPVTQWTDTLLANGRPARSVDLNDLVMVNEFQGAKSDTPFYYNSGYMKPVPFMMLAKHTNDIVGFKLTWAFNPNDNYYTAKKLPYGADIWNPVTKAWDAWIDKATTVKQSTEVTNTQGIALQVVDVRLPAPRPGTYRFDIGYGGNASFLGSTAYDPVTQTYTSPAPFTYYTCAEGHTQPEVYFYIPKGVQSLDLEVWDSAGGKQLTLYQGLPNGAFSVSRQLDISGMGTHRVALQPGEDGTVASLYGDGFSFPFLYSVPTLWAKSPGALLVPRAIANADGLTSLP